MSAAGRVGDVSGVWLIGYGPYTDREKIVAAAEIVDTVHPVAGRFHVTGDQYFCVRTGCTCPAARGLPFDPRNTVAAATMTARGVVTLPSRQHLLDLVGPDPQAQQAIRTKIDGLPAATLTGPHHLIGPLEQAAADTRLSDSDAARLGVALVHKPTQLAAWEATDHQMWQRNLWLDMTRRLPPSHVSPAANLAAWCAWRRGEPDLAIAALSRARLARPASTLSRLIASLLAGMVKPQNVPWPLSADELDRLRRER